MVYHKTWEFKRNPHGLKIHLDKLIRKGYRRNMIIKSLNMVFVGTNTDFLANSLIPK